MRKHIQMLGILYLIHGALGMMAATLIFFLISAASMMHGVEVHSHLVIWLPGSLGLIISGIIAIFALPHIIAGWAILTHKEWGRLLGLAVAAFSLIEFPIGTALGIYGFWVLIHEETIAIFNPRRIGKPVTA